MKILIVEDDLNKLRQLEGFLKTLFTDAQCDVALSYQSGLNSLISRPCDVVILDMQLPTFDKTPSEDGGRRRSLAGRELLRQLNRRGIKTPAIVVTQLREFGEESERMSLEELRRQLTDMKVPNYRGLVYYHPQLVTWKAELGALLKLCRDPR
jgi:DNA-binding response OmpR family regulator